MSFLSFPSKILRSAKTPKPYIIVVIWHHKIKIHSYQFVLNQALFFKGVVSQLFCWSNFFVRVFRALACWTRRKLEQTSYCLYLAFSAGILKILKSRSDIGISSSFCILLRSNCFSEELTITIAFLSANQNRSLRPVIQLPRLFYSKPACLQEIKIFW